jgi:hypothetical protein
MLSEEYHNMIIRELPMILICKLMTKMKKIRNVNNIRKIDNVELNQERKDTVKNIDQLNMKS